MTTASVLLESDERFISSIILSNNRILTYTTNYLILSDSSTGDWIAKEWSKEDVFDEFLFLVTWIEWSDHTIITVYNNAIFQYRDTLEFYNFEEFLDERISTKNKYTLLAMESAWGFLFGYINNNTKEAIVCWYNSNWFMDKTIVETEISSATQVACEIYNRNHYLCCYVVPDTFVQCFWYDQDLVKVEPTWNSNVKWYSEDVSSIKLKKHDTNAYFICSHGNNEIIRCNQITISSSSQIIFGTGVAVLDNVKYFGDDRNYNLEKVNSYEYLVSYSNGNELYAQKIEFDLSKSGGWIVFSDVPDNKGFKIFWFNHYYILLFDQAQIGVFIRLQEVIKCWQFCLSTDIPTNSVVKFNKVVSTSKIWFTSLNIKGTLKTATSLEAVVTNQEYDAELTSFELTSSDIVNEESFTFVAVGTTMSEECPGVIFNGIKFDCSCPVTYYQYEGECWENCSDYLYSDTLNKRCVNCKSQGQYWYDRQCIDSSDIPEGYFVSDDVYNTISPCLSPCKTCENTATNCLTYLPLDCEDGEYNDLNNNTCEKCHSFCSVCSTGGSDATTNCDTCATGYISYVFNPTQCYKECSDSSSERWYIDIDRNVICIPVTSCPSEYPIYVPETNQCVTSCSKSSECQYCISQPSDWFIFKNICLSSCPKNTIPDTLTGKCEATKPGPEIIPSEDDKKDIMDSISKNITDYLDKDKDVIIVGDNYTVEITDSNSTLNKINLGECETILRNYYKIPSNENLLVVKLDLNREGKWTNQVEYMIYTHKGELVDLNLCNDVKITIKYPVKEPNDLNIPLINDYLDKGIDVFDSKSDFFNDICYPFTDDNGKDITLTDRQNDIYQNISFCEDKCNYTGFNTSDSSVTCDCTVKTEVSVEKTENAINAEFFLNSWNSVIDELNFEIWQCYRLLWDWKYLKENIGFWLFFALMLLHVPLFIWMGLSGYKPIKIKMVINQDGNQGSPPKRKQWYNDETVMSDCISRVVENEGTENADIIDNQTRHENNEVWNYDALHHVNGNKKRIIKLQSYELENHKSNNFTYRPTNSLHFDNPFDSATLSSIVIDQRITGNSPYNNSNNNNNNNSERVIIRKDTKKKSAQDVSSCNHLNRKVEDRNDYIHRPDEEYEYNFSPSLIEWKGKGSSDHKQSFDSSIVFNQKMEHWADSLGMEHKTWNNNREETTHSKKTTSSFVKNKEQKRPRRGSLYAQIQGNPNKESISSDDGFSNDQLIIIEHQTPIVSVDRYNHSEKKDDNIETLRMTKRMTHQIRNTNEHKNNKLRKDNSINILNHNNNKQSQISQQSADSNTKTTVSFSRAMNSNSKNINNTICNTETTHVTTSAGLRTTTINDDKSNKKRKIDSWISIPSTTIYSKTQTLKEKKSLSKSSKKKVTEHNNLMAPSHDFLDDFTMEEAIVYDTRSFCMKYYVCLKAKQGIWQTFLFKSPFELKVIRILMFMFTISMEFAFNTVFYTDSMVSNSYSYEGSVGFWFTLQNNMIVTILSNIASWIWGSLWLYLSNSSDKLKIIYETSKSTENVGKYYTWIKRGLSCLTIKLSIFIFFEIILMLFFWYYISLFCAVFKNNQKGWWQGGLMSWLIGNVMPLGVAFVIVVWRDIAMQKKWGKIFRWSLWMYRF